MIHFVTKGNEWTFRSRWFNWRLWKAFLYFIFLHNASFIRIISLSNNNGIFSLNRHFINVSITDSALVNIGVFDGEWWLRHKKNLKFFGSFHQSQSHMIVWKLKSYFELFESGWIHEIRFFWLKSPFHSMESIPKYIILPIPEYLNQLNLGNYNSKMGPLWLIELH